MANTLTNLYPDLYEGLDVVSRELTGFIPSVSMDNSVERAALDQTVRVPVTQAQTAADNTPAVTPPDTGDQTIDNVEIVIDNSRHVPIRWNGEQTRGYRTNGQYSSTLAQQTAQAIRTLVNEIEADIAAEYIRTSRAYGTAGTTPFASNLADAAQIRKILDDNGAPMAGRSLVIDTAAGVNLRSLTQLTSANTAGTDGTLRNGVLLDLFGMGVRESAQIQSHTAGTASGATTDNAGYAVGTTTLTLASAGTGTILAGDVITFAGDTNKYVVVTGDADVSGGGTVVIAKPGLKVAIAASATAITVGSAYTANMGFSPNAIQLATRMPAMPEGGDVASDVMNMTDPRTGLTIEVAEYKQFLQNSLHVRVAWGVKLIKPEHAAILLG
jgi:hypothetical protein